MTALAPRRRIALALVALSLSALLFRGPIAAALIARGDGLLSSGDLDGAARVYRRARWFDHGAGVTDDRLAFAYLLRRQRGDAVRAFIIATTALRTSPANVALLADRGFAAGRLGRWRIAEAAFASAAASGRDPRYAHLASHMAHRAGDIAGERALLCTALAIDGRYTPARVRLAMLQR